MTIVLFCSADRLGGALVVCIASSTPKFSVAQIQSFESVEGSSSFIVRMELFSASIIKFTSLNLKVHYGLSSCTRIIKVFNFSIVTANN